MCLSCLLRVLFLYIKTPYNTCLSIVGIEFIRKLIREEKCRITRQYVKYFIKALNLRRGKFSLLLDVWCVTRIRIRLIICCCTLRFLGTYGVRCFLFGIVWLMPSSVMWLLQVWAGDKLGREIQRRWSVIRFCLQYTIWRERSGRCFQGKERPIVHIHYLFLGLYIFG